MDLQVDISGFKSGLDRVHEIVCRFGGELLADSVIATSIDEQASEAFGTDPKERQVEESEVGG